MTDISTPAEQQHAGAPAENWRRYEFIVNTSRELMALINREYCYEAINDAHCLARNQTREEILGRSVSDLWSEETFYGTVKDPLDRCFTGEEVNYQAYYKHAAIGLRYMDVTCYPYYGANNEVTHVVVVQRDITEREKAEQAMRRYAQRLETLHEIDRGILAAQSPEEIAEAALEHLQYLVPCQQASIVLFNREARASQTAPAESGRTPARKGRPGSSAQVFELGQVRTLAEFSHRHSKNGNNENGAHENEADKPISFVNIPLVVQGELLGTLSMGSRDPAAFGGEHAEIAREVAYQVALAVQQAQLRQTLRRYTTELEVLVSERTKEIERRRQVAEGMRDILTILNSVRPLDEVLEYIMSQSQLLLNTDAVAFFSFADKYQESDELQVPTLQTSPLTQPERALSQQLAHLAALKHAPLILPDLAPHLLQTLDVSLDSEEAWANVRYKSLLVVPLLMNQDVYGAIALYFSTAHNFSDEEIGTATSLADQAALAIENARLHLRAEQVAVLEERERLARELHDSVTQSLYSLMLFSEAGQRLMRSGETLRVQEYFTQLSETAQQALKEMRLLLYELRPAALEHEGLIGALKRRLEAVEKRAGIEVRLVVVDSIVLPPLIEETLYRIAQEALNNSLKHANASKVEVCLAREETHLLLRVQDDGVGFDRGRASESGGMGLENMYERVRKIGGQMHVDSAPNTGTTITVRIEKTDIVSERTGTETRSHA